MISLGRDMPVLAWSWLMLWTGCMVGGSVVVIRERPFASVGHEHVVGRYAGGERRKFDGRRAALVEGNG